MEKEPEDSLNQVFIQNNEGEDDDDDDGNEIDAPFNLDDALLGNNTNSIDRASKEGSSPKKQ